MAENISPATRTRVAAAGSVCEQDHLGLGLGRDGEESARLVISQIRLAFLVRVENHSQKAMEVARAFKPDAIILDIIMPEMEGSEVARQMKADPELKTIPIGFMTATVMKQQTQAMGGLIGEFGW